MLLPMPRKLLSLGIILFIAAGCTVYRPLGNPQKSGLPDFYRHYYDYPKLEKISGQIVFEEKTESYILRRVEFPLSLPDRLQVSGLEKFKASVETLSQSDHKTADDLKLRYVNRVDYYVPRHLKPGARRPVILISPILGGNMVVDHFAKYYAGRGYVAAIVHRKRTFWDEERKDVQQVEDYMRISVMRLRQPLDWLETQPEADPGRIGAFGVSYGAILHSVLAAVDDRVRYHVLAMPAGDLPDVIMECPDKAITKMVKKAEEVNGWSKPEIRRQLQETIKTDPLYLAPHVPRKKVEIYVALFDHVVGAGRSFQLWRAFGRPKLKILPFGHYGGSLVFPHLETQSYLAFKKHLN